MPRQKDFKRIVRSRIQKTGESYTAARSQLLKRNSPQPPATPDPADYAKLAGMSDETIETKTGCNWERWVRHLDYFGALEKPHREIATHVHEAFGISGWWAQAVTVGYERIKGLREIGQRRSGAYEASKSGTFPVPVETLFAYFNDGRKRKRWLPGVSLEIRKASPYKSIRITWEDQTSVELWFTARGETKSSVAVQHTKLPNRERVNELKQYWKERFEALRMML